MNLIQKIKLDDSEAFNEAFNLYHQKLYYYVLSKTNSHFQAEEIVQLTFIKLWQYRHNLNHELPLSSQMFRIAKTTFIDQFRKLKSADSLIIRIKNNPSVVDVNNGPGNLFEQDVTQQLQAALATMPAVRKKVFELSRFEGLSYKEIASQLAISIKTVENHINLSLKHVRKYIRFSIVILFVLLK
jgi:RNA polymerase sigma-70 factor (ECF subfamily)